MKGPVILFTEPKKHITLIIEVELLHDVLKRPLHMGWPLAGQALLRALNGCASNSTLQLHVTVQA
jgi:hypothetical protein